MCEEESLNEDHFITDINNDVDPEDLICEDCYDRMNDK